MTVQRGRESDHKNKTRKPTASMPAFRTLSYLSSMSRIDRNMQFSNTHALVDFTSHQSLFSLSFVCFSSHRASSSSFTPRSRSIPKKTSISFLFLILPYIMCVSIFYSCPSSLHVPLSYPFFLSTVLPLLLF